MLEGRGTGGVKEPALAREELTLDRLLEQRMSKPEATRPAFDPGQESARFGLPQGSGNHAGRQTGRSDHEVVVDLGPRHCRYPEDSASCLGYRRQPGAQKVMEHRRKLGSLASTLGSEELLGEEGVAITPHRQPLDESIVRGPIEDTASCAAISRLEKRGNFDSFHVTRAPQLSERGADAAVREGIVRPDRQHQREGGSRGWLERER